MVQRGRGSGAGSLSDIDSPVELFRALHETPERSGAEVKTAALVRAYLERQAPERILSDLGGNGVAALFEARREGPRVLVRCELDALPLEDGTEGGPRSEATHTCGHDGHMALVAALARSIREDPLERGSLVLLFEPEEETGAGASAVLNDPAFADFRPDVVFAAHNVPGYPLGTVLVRDGVFASTARSLRVRMEGRSSHAAEPWNGVSPAPALAEILTGWPRAATGGEGGLVTVVHARLGEPALGTSPGTATVVSTLRAQSDSVMDELSAEAVRIAENAAKKYGLTMHADWLEVFPCTVNAPRANAVVERAARLLGLPVERMERPFGWTEDFGRMTAAFGGALFGLGSGEGAAPLHHPEYVFPESLVTIGARLMRSVVNEALSEEWPRTKELT